MKLRQLRQVEIWYLEETKDSPILQKTTHGWAVRDGIESSLVLTTKGEWMIEPGPSRRLDDLGQFLAEYRFRSPDEAINTYSQSKLSIDYQSHPVGDTTH